MHVCVLQVRERDPVTSQISIREMRYDLTLPSTSKAMTSSYDEDYDAALRKVSETCVCVCVCVCVPECLCCMGVAGWVGGRVALHRFCAPVLTTCPAMSFMCF